ncbi:hypothetical protein BC941DRAFT_446951 [Chlamydoabsidia padenii]|nr:hypothetical protein BC941DRAFT_446951 [Chlamydoabsidia padenii]
MELGLNKEPELDQNAEQNQPAERWMEQEVRRRVFWMVFTLDKLTSASTGRPSTIQVEDCDVLLPSDEYGWIRGQFYTETMDGSRVAQFNVGELRDSSLLGISSLVSPSTRITGTMPKFASSSNGVLSCHAYLLRANALLGRIATFVNRTTRERMLPPSNPDSEFAKLDRCIDEWYDQLPPAMKYTQENMDRHRMSPTVDSSRFVLAHIMHNTLTVLLHRPSLVFFDTLNSEVVQPSLKEFCRASVEKCLHAVDNVTTILKTINSNVDLMPPFLTYLSYTVATIVVNNTFSSKPDEAKKARTDLNEHFRLLQSMRKYWAMADKLYFMIRDLYAMHSNTIRQSFSSASSTSNSNGSLIDGTSPRSTSSPSMSSPTTWNNGSTLISPVSAPPASSSVQQSHQLKQSSPTLCELNLTHPTSNQGNTSIDNNFLPTNNNFYPGNNNVTSWNPSLRKMSLAELALSTCDGASCTNWTVGDNRENIAAALQSLMGRAGGSGGNGPVANQSMFDLNSTSSVPVSNPSIDTLAFNLGYSNMDQYNTSSAP